MRWLGVFGLVGIAFAQTIFNYSDSAGNLQVRAKDAQGSQIKGGYRFDLKGGASVVSKRQGMSLSANQITVEAVASKGSNSPDEVKNAKATGSVKFDQSAGARKTTLTCANANYKSLGETAQLDTSGGVTIQSFDSAKKESLNAKGASGTAMLDRKAEGGFGLRTATLTNGVRVEVIESGNQNSRVVFTGDKLTMDPNKITLTGHVKAQGKNSTGLGNLGNVDVLVINLKDQKMTSFSFRTGGGK